MNITKKVISIAKETIATELELIELLIKQERNASEETKQARRSMTDQYLDNFKATNKRTFGILESGDNIK